LAKKHDLYVLADEIYEELVFDGEHVPAVAFDEDGRVISISGFSKTYAMTGWRLGWAIADEGLIKAINKMLEPLISCPSSISQEAGVAALTGTQQPVAVMREAYRTRRDIAVEVLEPAGLLPVRPQGAFYAIVDLRECGITSRELAIQLLKETYVATAPGDTFGKVLADGFVRISLASSDDDVREGCERIVVFRDRIVNRETVEQAGDEQASSGKVR
jgi:aspartate aminotransferase/aminotransferase